MQVAVFLVILFIFIIYRIAYHIEANQVKNTSKRYHYLQTLPQALGAEKLERVYTYRKRMNSKAQLDRIDVDKQIMNLIAENTPPADLIQKGAVNRRKLTEFERQVLSSPDYRKPERGFYAHVEKKLVKKLEKTSRPVVPIFIVNFYYTSPKKKNHYNRNYTFSVEQMEQYIKKIKDMEKYRQSAQYQRSVMSDSIRYDVMKRDGFKCVLCGASAADGVKLHVDHIRPVSKGGKTEMGNLRTLCERCNLGKRDKFDRSGPN